MLFSTSKSAVSVRLSQSKNNTMEHQRSETLDLFGGEKCLGSEWDASDWTASDGTCKPPTAQAQHIDAIPDRVRGGKSQSSLDVSDPKIGRFHGTLDIKTLGGAGFASQRTTGDDRTWDLSAYKGIKLNIVKGDKRRYTFNLKDSIPSQRPDGRDEASISWEVDFTLPPESEPGDSHARSIVIPFASFNPTYRGRPKKDAAPLDLKTVKRLSIMMRSFFGTQEGEFSLSMRSIQAVSKIPGPDGGDDKGLARVVDGRRLEEGAELEGTEGQKNQKRQPLLLAKFLLGSAIGVYIGYRLAVRWMKC
ncbi:Complex I intermediate-associated protein 30 (CIA30) [Teratosphaeria destructans]|uniref:Complex I intermediate-associated protein 30 (CIA30) n=1 Tax=Teratosphaeria destructans TaxID=418781 RepID=A0A9W7SIG4_9PEZI|nr:Complex I intermediate-associated protein 30 (CIA30) [Teratosphaeria destructans]